MFQRAITYIVATCMLFVNSYPIYVNAKSGGENLPLAYEKARQRLDKLMHQLVEMRADIDQSQFDLYELLEKLNYDKDKIIEFVKTEIYFEQYQGLLRGAKGTLMSKAGNALDQSVLLAALLKDAGLEARVARTELTEEQSSTLIDEMSRPRAILKDAAVLNRFNQVLSSFARDAGWSEDEVVLLRDSLSTPVHIEDTALFQQAKADVLFIKDRLGELNIHLGDSLNRSELVREGRDYFWVEWRAGPTGSWSIVHPALHPDSSDFGGLVATAYYSETVPPELQHRIRFEVSVEQKVGKELKLHKVMNPFEVPVANVAGSTVSYVNLPSRLSTLQGYKDVAKSLQESSIFIPVLNGQLAPGGKAFDLDGNVIPPFAAASAYAEFFEAVGGKAESAARAIGSLGLAPGIVPDENLRALTAQFVDYTFIRPGGSERTLRRVVFDRLGAESRNTGSVTLLDNVDLSVVRSKLFEELTFVIAVGEFSAAFVVDRMLGRLIQSRGLLEDVIARAAGAGEGFGRIKGADMSSGMQLQMYLLFDFLSDQRNGPILYRAEPSLVANRVELNVGDGLYAAIDVVQNKKRGFRVDTSGKLQFRATDLVLAGVWETRVEENGLGRQVGAVVTAPRILDEARKLDIPIEVIGPANRAVLDGLRVEANAKDAMRADLDAGFYVLTPKVSIPNLSATGWWRVNPVTGETLGIVGGGMGASITEYLGKLVVAVSVGGVAYYWAWKGCAGDVPIASTGNGRISSQKALGCTLCAAFAFASGALIGYMVAGYAVTAWANTAPRTLYVYQAPRHMGNFLIHSTRGMPAARHPLLWRAQLAAEKTYAAASSELLAAQTAADKAAEVLFTGACGFLSGGMN